MNNEFYASTCGFSKLPINKDDAVHFVLLSPCRGRTAPTVFKPHSLYKPVGIPIRGKYDGAGSLIVADDDEGNFYRKTFAQQFGIPLKALLEYVASDKSVFDEGNVLASYLFGDRVSGLLGKKALSSLLCLGFMRKNQSYIYRDKSVYIKVLSGEGSCLFKDSIVLINGINYPHGIQSLSGFIEEIYYSLHYILGVEETYLSAFETLAGLTGMFVHSQFVTHSRESSEFRDYLDDIEEAYVSESIKWLKRVKHYQHKYGEDEVDIAHMRGLTFYREIISQSNELSTIVEFLFPKEYVWELPILLENPYHLVRSLSSCLSIRELFEVNRELFTPQLSIQDNLMSEVSKKEQLEHRHQRKLSLLIKE